MHNDASKQMSGNPIEDAHRNEDRLRFHIENNTSDWRSIMQCYPFLWTQTNQYYLVCLSKPQSSRLPHYLCDPIHDNFFPIQPLSLSTTIFQIISKLRKCLKLNDKTSITISHNNRILNPSHILGSLKPEYGVVVFLHYNETEPFG